MKKIILLFITIFTFSVFAKAQTTAMQLTGLDCNGVSHDLFADLDAGKAVLLHFFMANCSSCPPPAQKIQAMANGILATYPGMITGYAIPYSNSTTCAYTSSWVSTSNLSLYAPYDSGAVQVAHYGGFGMPTVVLLGGTDHRVMFSTLSFSTSDTTIMRDSILALLSSTTGINGVKNTISSFQVFPNPAMENLTVQLELSTIADVQIDLTDLAGKQIAVIMNEKQNGTVRANYNIATLPSGNYLVRIQVNGKTETQKLAIRH